MEVQWPASTISFELEFSMMNHRPTAHKLMKNRYVRITSIVCTNNLQYDRLNLDILVTLFEPKLLAPSIKKQLE